VIQSQIALEKYQTLALQASLDLCLQVVGIADEMKKKQEKGARF
jgi:hypothetical protein